MSQLLNMAKGGVGKAPGPRGFTLLEALVALTLVAVGLLACLKATAQLNQQHHDLAQRQAAQWNAHNMAQRIALAGIFPPEQTWQGACPQGPFALQCEVRVFNTPNPFLRRVEVRVLKDAAPGPYALAKQVLFVGNLP